jgi:hypothetical protein
MRVTIVPVGRPEADLLCIFAEDLSGAGFDATVTDRVFGLAESQGRVALISLARLSANAEPGKARARALKEALQELGHTLGLGHCDNSRCVMRFSNASPTPTGRPAGSVQGVRLERGAWRRNHKRGATMARTVQCRAGMAAISSSVVRRFGRTYHPRAGIEG